MEFINVAAPDSQSLYYLQWYYWYSSYHLNTDAHNTLDTIQLQYFCPASVIRSGVILVTIIDFFTLSSRQLFTIVLLLSVTLYFRPVSLQSGSILLAYMNKLCIGNFFLVSFQFFNLSIFLLLILTMSVDCVLNLG